jgi:triacylglycerol lipase
VVVRRSFLKRPSSYVNITQTTTMGATLSPFRYFELARILIHRVLETKPRSKAIPIPVQQQQQQQLHHDLKGKSRAIDSPLSTPSTYDIPQSSTLLSTASSVASSSSSSTIPVSPPKGREILGPDPSYPPEPGDIYRLMNDERLMIPGGIKPPREIVVLCHGVSERLFGVEVLMFWL